MIHGLTLREYVEDEKNKTAEMDRLEKISYFKEYYLKMCIVGAVLLALLIWFIMDMTLNMRHTIICGGAVNIEIDEMGKDLLTAGYMDYVNGNSKKEKVDFAGSIFTDSEEPQTFTVFQAELASSAYDYLIVDRVALDFIHSCECDVNLSTVLDEAALKEAGDRVIYFSNEEGVSFPAAVDISDSGFITRYLSGNAGGKVYFVVTGFKDDYSEENKLFNYLMGF